MKVSVILPTKNESENIGQLVNELITLLEASGVVFEILVVDDGSTDDTIAIVNRLSMVDERIKPFERQARHGLTPAILEGSLRCNGDWILVMDSDGQHAPSDALRLISCVSSNNSNVELVVGTRYQESFQTDGFGLSRKVVSLFATLISKFFIKADCSDPMSGFFFINRSTLDKVRPIIHGNGYKVLFEILVLNRRMGLSLNTQEVLIKFRERTGGESKFSAVEIFRLMCLWISCLIPLAVPRRYLDFVIAGMLGATANILLVGLGTGIFDLAYIPTLVIASEVAILINFFSNNLLTFSDRRLEKRELLSGMIKFNIFCALGGVITVSVASQIYSLGSSWFLSTVIGAFFGSVWNFSINNVLTWANRKSLDD